MAVTVCPTCGEYIFSFGEKHRCPPEWEVCCPEYADPEDADSWHVVRAPTAAEAATRLVEKADRKRGEGLSSETEVRVRRPGESESVTYVVHGEIVPRYCATRV